MVKLIITTFLLLLIIYNAKHSDNSESPQQKKEISYADNQRDFCKKNSE